jgi:hypothetical protein
MRLWPSAGSTFIMWGWSRKLKSRAPLENLSLSNYLLREIRRVAECRPIRDQAERLVRRATVNVRVSPSE